LARGTEVYRSDPATQRDALKRVSNGLVVIDAGVLVFGTCGRVTL
jgi:hypothetical protein